MKRIRTAIIGTGFMGRVHLVAVRRLGFVEVAAIAGRRIDAARSMADAFHIGEWNLITTEFSRSGNPGHSHLHTQQSPRPIAKAALAACKHVLCSAVCDVDRKAGDKLSRARRILRNCTCHNLRYYPMVQQMRSMREAGDLGEILVVGHIPGLASARHRLELADRVGQERPVPRDGRYRIALVRHGRA
jgi:predicted dehydrogenase